MAASTGICRSAHSIRFRPSSASARSFTSCRLVVAIPKLLPLGGQQPLVLALFPIKRSQLAPGEPAVDRGSQLRLVAKPSRERQLAQLDAKAAPQLFERAQLVQLE